MGLIRRANALTGPTSALLLRALTIACGEVADVEAIASEAIAHQQDGICVQVLGLLASSQQPQPQWTSIAQSRSQSIEDPHRRREILSIQEALEYLTSFPAREFESRL